jgi:hypothetical protein
VLIETLLCNIYDRYDWDYVLTSTAAALAIESILVTSPQMYLFANYVLVETTGLTREEIDKRIYDN